jgi:glutamyl-tRNA reductase
MARDAAATISAMRDERLVEVGTDFQASSLDVLSRARLSDERVPGFLRQLTQAGIPEVALLSTCNRFELYAATHAPEETIAALDAEVRSLLGGSGHVETVVRRDREAVAHLVAVAAGLESALLGEHEILGQVRRARGTAVEAGTAGASVDRLFDHALRHGRRIRRALGISNLRRSLTELATDWISARLTEPERRAAVIVGAGETASQMASQLRALGIGALTVANRSVARSQELANAVGGRAEPLQRLPALLSNADLLVLATSAPEPLLSEAAAVDALSTRSAPLYLVDLGLAPNAEPAVSKHPLITTLTLSDVVGLALADSSRERSRTMHAETLVQEAADEFALLANSRAASTV